MVPLKAIRLEVRCVYNNKPVPYPGAVISFNRDTLFSASILKDI
jgi:hypothetical protein